MPPRLRIQPVGRSLIPSTPTSNYICARCISSTTTNYATAAAVSVPAPSESQIHENIPQLSRHHPLQPPSHRSPSYLRSQKLRAYVSLLQSTPLMLFFQHNNLKASEWAAIRRELARAVAKVDASSSSSSSSPPDQDSEPSSSIADATKLQVIAPRIFEPALRITSYFDTANPPAAQLLTAETGTHTLPDLADDATLTHVLSRQAYTATLPQKGTHPLTPLLKGSLAVLIMPTVSPQHLAAALSVLSPVKGVFPQPTRRAAPSYHEPAVQDGLRKLLLLGARVEGRVFDLEGVRWMGGISGGIDGLRAQLVSLLQMAGVGLTGALEGVGKGLWMTVEGRRRDMEERENPGAGSADGAASEGAASAEDTETSGAADGEKK